MVLTQFNKLLVAPHPSPKKPSWFSIQLTLTAVVSDIELMGSQLVMLLFCYSLF
jgi:hypothetical protein